MSLLQALYSGGWLRAVDHALGLSLRHAREETPDWVQAAAALASRALAQGHSQLPLAQVAALLADVDPERALPALPPLEEWRALLAASPWVHVLVAGDASAGDDAPRGTRAPPDRVLVLEGDALTLRRYHDLEVRLAQALLARANPAAPRLHLVTGGPGTGKTTRVAQLLVDAARADALRDDDGSPPRALRVLLAAPTGKAASRLSESVRESLTRQVLAGDLDARIAAQLPTEASTVHRLLGWQGRDGFRHHRDNPLPADLVVVDEASMIDLPLMCRLVEAVGPDARLVLVGDRDQLPSVDIGDVLAALCDASERAGSPLAARREHLSHSHRQAGDVDVPLLAAHVRSGDIDAVLGGLAAHAFRGVRWRDEGDRALQDAVLEAALPHYRALAEHASVADALNAARAYRVLCAMREGPAGSIALNAAIGTALDPLHAGEGLFKGRLLIVTENSYRQQLFNGDIGIVWPDESGEPRVWFDADGGPRAWLPAALPAHAPAFALTVHKSQGSEFERVFLALPAHATRVLSRELLYTGLTRCRSEVTLWAGEGALREAIGRRAHRWSGLAARLASPGTAGARADGDANAAALAVSDARSGEATGAGEGGMQGSLF